MADISEDPAESTLLCYSTGHVDSVTAVHDVNVPRSGLLMPPRVLPVT